MYVLSVTVMYHAGSRFRSLQAWHINLSYFIYDNWDCRSALNLHYCTLESKSWKTPSERHLFFSWAHSQEYYTLALGIYLWFCHTKIGIMQSDTRSEACNNCHFFKIMDCPFIVCSTKFQNCNEIQGRDLTCFCFLASVFQNLKLLHDFFTTVSEKKFS